MAGKFPTAYMGAQMGGQAMGGGKGSNILIRRRVNLRNVMYLVILQFFQHWSTLSWSRQM